MFLHSHHAQSRSNRDDILAKFSREIDELDALYRYQIQAIENDYDRWTNEYYETLRDPEDADGGDAHYYATEKLGTEPLQAFSHISLMTIVRAVALTELTLAHLAATYWEQPEMTVFPKGKTWYYAWAEAFYKSVPKSGMTLGSNGFNVLQAIRNTYAHGYGISGTEGTLKDLARKAWNSFPRTPATKAEKALGYDGEARFFTGASQFDHTGVPKKLFGSVPMADMTPLMTHRAIERLRTIVTEAKRCLESGIRDDYETSDFIRLVEQYWSEA